MVQGNVNFLFLIHVWYNLILHMYFWLSFQRISLTFYGYLLRVWYILFVFCLFLARNPCVNVVSHKLSLKLFKSQSQYQCKFSLFYSYLDHSHATVYLWLSFQRISLTFYGHVLHMRYIFG